MKYTTTVGELKAQLADIPDDSPLLILYDRRCGVSTTIEILTDLPAEDRVDWPEDPNVDKYVYLDISRGQG
jgi:hypothetical protein